MLMMLISETLHQINLDSVTVATIVFYAAKLHHTPTLAHTLLIGAMLLLLALTFAAIECMVPPTGSPPFTPIPCPPPRRHRGHRTRPQLTVHARPLHANRALSPP